MADAGLTVAGRGHGMETLPQRVREHPRPTRWVRVPGSLNARDLGGLPAAGGRVTRFGVVYRCAADREPLPAFATALYERHGEPVQVFDLRSASELEGEVEAVPGVTMHRMAIGEGSAKFDHPLGATGRDYVRQYLAMLPAAAGAVQRLLNTVAGTPDRIVITCRLGKDRTGLVCLLLLHCLDVAPRWIVRDYCLTARGYRARPEWVSRYATSRAEAESEVLRRISLPASVPAEILRHLGTSTAWNGVQRPTPSAVALARLLEAVPNR